MVNSRVKLPRKKTGILRDLPLWPETIAALKKTPRKGQLVFDAPSWRLEATWTTGIFYCQKVTVENDPT